MWGLVVLGSTPRTKPPVSTGSGRRRRLATAKFWMLLSMIASRVLGWWIDKVLYSSHGSQVVNVRDYGATGNGITDDAKAIQSAVAAVTGTGGTVDFPPGTYRVGTAIAPANNVALIGSGVGSAIIAPTGPVSAVLGNSTKSNPLTRFTMAHLTIDGTNQGPSFNVGIKGVFCTYLVQCQFEDLV